VIAPAQRPAIVALAFLIAGLNCAEPQDAPAPEIPRTVVQAGESNPSGHVRMLALLKDIADKTATEHPLLSESRSVQLRAELAALPADAHPRKKLDLHLALGEEALRQNRLEEGIAHLDQAYRDAEKFLELGVAHPKAVYNTAYRLAIGHMRLGETQNCCLKHTADSCLLPIGGGGIHQDQAGSRKAIEHFERVLQLAPPDSDLFLNSKWLLNIAYMTIDGYPGDVPTAWRIPESVYRSTEQMPRFLNRAPELGLDTFDLAGGAIVEDFDGDGLLDIFVSTYDPTQGPHFFRNDGRGGFVDRSVAANLDGLLGGFNLEHADYDNDGDADVLMLRGAWLGASGQIPNSLLRNDGHGRFTDVTFEAGLGEVHYPTQTAAWADYDNDGDLDLYIGNESVADLLPSCQLFRNEGDGTFVDVAATAGVTNDRFSKSVGWGDYDNDGDPDLYVSNLGGPNRLYRNEGDGTFVDVAGDLGVDRPLMSFAAWFWDYDNDGNLDIHVAAYDWNEGGLDAFVRSTLGLPHGVETTALYRGDGRGGFKDVGVEAGFDRVTLPMGHNFGDLDSDGWLDVYLGTGYPDYEALMPNVMYLNRAGKGFVDVTYSAGLGHLQKGHGVVFADIDHDGDQDLFEQLGGFFYGDKFANALFENPGSGNRWLAVELEGRRANRSAIGARLRVDVVENGTPRSIYRTLNTGGSFGSNPLRQTIGLGRAERIERLDIRWPGSNATRVIEDLPLDRLVRVVEGRDDYDLRELEPLRPDSGGQEPSR
jgi:hypothetical protein